MKSVAVVNSVKTVSISGSRVGKGQPCFIIAEAGVNHNGDITLARKLIDVAGKAGADAVKFQTFHVDALVTARAEKARYQRETTGGKSQSKMLKKLELSPDEFKKLSSYARKKGIIFLSTPFDAGSIDLLAELEVPAYKVASGEITNFPLLKHIAARKKPVILSTGMSTMDEVSEAVELLRKEGLEEIVLLHCVSCYPARPEDMNLRVMETLRRTFGLPVGLSDHTTGTCVPLAAVALGACIIEKHFTLDRSLPGPDHRASLEPTELKDMIQAIRDIEQVMGDGIKRVTAEEAANQKAARRSLVARVSIPAGTLITRDMLDIKRPGTGLAPGLIDSLIGKKAKRAVKAGEVITAGVLG